MVDRCWPGRSSARGGDVADTDERRLDVGLICRTGDIGDVLVDDTAVSGLLRWVSRSGTEALEVREGLAASIAKRQHKTAAGSNVSRQTLWSVL